MEITTWMIIYLPILLYFFVILPSDNKKAAFLRRHRLKKGRQAMSNSMIESLVGKEVMINTGSIGSVYDKVTVLEVVDNWVKVEKKVKLTLLTSIIFKV